jgi:amino acid transporter
LKAIIMTALVVTLIAVSAGAHQARPIGFRYWTEGAFLGIKGYEQQVIHADGRQEDLPILSPATGKWFGFWYGMVQATFAYTGAEIFGASFGEVMNPQKNIPTSVKLTFWRIIIVYIVSVFMVTLSVSARSSLLLGAVSSLRKDGGASPFVIAVKEAGIPVLPDIFNGCLLVFTLSAANAG